MRRSALYALLFILVACGPDEPVQPPDNNKTERYLSIAPVFQADSAYLFVKKQVEFGPRVPLTIPHEKCAAWLQEQFKKYGAGVQLHSGTVNAYDGKNIQLRNIIASYAPEKKKRVLLAAHWDTRPMADRDSVDKEKPIDGANDGASGVGVLLEVARNIQLRAPGIGIDIILFDMEDYGSKFCLGSEYWSKFPHTPGYMASYGILLDMVGGKNATFPVEGISMQYATNVVHKVWERAGALGYGHMFLWNEMQPITDDHVHINQIAGIPCVDIIQMDPNTGDFGPFHHRHSDNMEGIDKQTLKAVGQTIMEVIYGEQP